MAVSKMVIRVMKMRVGVERFLGRDFFDLGMWG